MDFDSEEEYTEYWDEKQRREDYEHNRYDMEKDREEN